MPRLRRAALPEGGSTAPVELLTTADEVWQSARSTAHWLNARGLTISPRELDCGPLTRFAASALVWARSAGLTRPPMASGFVGTDWARMRALGIPTSSGAMSERLDAIDLMREATEHLGGSLTIKNER